MPDFISGPVTFIQTISPYGDETICDAILGHIENWYHHYHHYRHHYHHPPDAAVVWWHTVHTLCQTIYLNEIQGSFHGHICLHVMCLLYIRWQCWDKAVTNISLIFSQHYYQHPFIMINSNLNWSFSSSSDL